MCLNRIHVFLHQMGIDTKRYKKYCNKLQSRIDDAWLALQEQKSEYRKYWHMVYPFTGEYDMAIKEKHLTPYEAYEYIEVEFNK